MTTDSTETYWEVDGSSLQTYAYNITTLGGDRLAPPAVRGDDIVIPYMPGTKWSPKVPDKRIITLGMWVIGADADGSIPSDEDSRRTFDRNWRALRDLLWRTDEQMVLTKKFWVETSVLTAAGYNMTGVVQEGDWSLISASANASYASGLLPTMQGPSRATFTVDLLLSDPYFYGADMTVEFTTQTGGELPGPTRSISVLGDVRTTDITFLYEGPLTSPKFTLTSDSLVPWMQYGTVIADGDTAEVDVSEFAATHTASLVEYVSSGYVTHYGDKFFFYLKPGAATVALTVQAGTGTAFMVYKPAWL